jgi:S-adenosyl-L-methionine hydrolase (adenosine-forming)
MVTSLRPADSARPGTVVFLTDYGLRDPYVGVCHAVIARASPDVRVIDLTHGVPAQDVRAGALMLLDSLAYLPPAVVLAVVDPGVGTERRAVAVSAGAGASARWFVGPDNGLLAPALEAAGGARQAWSIECAPGIDLEVSGTFHGRDLFAPAAAFLADGGDAAALGSPLPVDSLTPLPFPNPEVGDGYLVAEVLLMDGFGSLALSAGEPDLVAAGLRRGDRLEVRVLDGADRAAASPGGGTQPVPAVLGRTFADVPTGDLVVLIDSAGRVAVAVNAGSASERLGAGPGLRIGLSPLSGPPSAFGGIGEHPRP